MINIQAIRCGLAFAPYLRECARAFVAHLDSPSMVVKQGGSGLIIRADSRMHLRYRNREAALDREEMRHYLATIRFRLDFFDVARLSDEVVLASEGATLLLSHPQSEIWLEWEAVVRLIELANGVASQESIQAELPDWLTASSGGERLLISDQRSGRWVLLGRDHIAEFERRIPALQKAASWPRPPTAPKLSMRGVTVRLQSGPADPRSS